MAEKKLKISTALGKLVDFLVPHLPVVNTHLVHFYSENKWNRLDEGLQSDLLALDETQLADLPQEFLESNFKNYGQHLTHLLKDINQHSLDALGVVDDLETVWSQSEIKPLESQINFDKFMKAKKTHEVGVLCDVVASLADNSNSELIVDLGCGKGALASMLSLNHGLYVSGVDAAGFNSHTEDKRQQKLQLTFNAIVRKNKCQGDDEKVEEEKANSLKFHRTTQYLSKDFDVRNLMGDSGSFFHQSFERCGIVGLHTCGNLASTSIQLFANSPECRFLCNVGCCYHMLDEAFEVDCVGEGSCHPGFPLSQQLQCKRFVLGRNARMVSQQPLERYAQTKQLHPDVLFYRAVLQVILKEKIESYSGLEFQVGRKRKPAANFREYARWALNKLELDLQLDDSELDGYLQRFECERKKLQAFFQLRLLLAHLAETTILLDRLAFLMEHENIGSSYLVKLFSGVTSPRCYALIAIKRPS